MSVWEMLWKIFGEEFVDFVDFEQIVCVVLCLLLVVVFGVVFGYECEQSGKVVGLCMYMLVIFGVVLFVMLL